MNYQALSLQCECGKPSSNIREVGFTSDHHLVLHWRCSQCKSFVYGLKPLHDCWPIHPNVEDSEEDGGLSAEAMRELDAKFLRELGVAFPEDEAAGPQTC